MKLVANIFFLLSLVLISFNLDEIRKNYPLASENMAIAEKMYAKLAASQNEDKAILIAYTGAYSTILAKHSKAIKDKKEYFKTGVTLLEQAINNDPNNIEIRCLRLGVQENSPKFLKYKGAIQTDKQFILDHYSTEPSQEIKAFVMGYIQQSTVFTQAEKRLF